MRLLKPIQVRCSAAALATFIEQAKRAYPKEHWAALLGHDSDTNGTRRFDVLEVFVPDDVAKHASTSAVYEQESWFIEAKETAAEAGLSLIGDIHSHPYTMREISVRGVDASPSQGDWRRFRWDGLTGIVTLRPWGRGLKAESEFWGPIAPIETTIGYSELSVSE